MREKPPTCADCPAFTLGKGFVSGEGPLTAQVALVGQGPGETEATLSRPFVSHAPSGYRLNRWLVAAGLRRSEMWVGNVVQCHLPGNRMPTVEEASYCYRTHWGPVLRSLPHLRLIYAVGCAAPSKKAPGVSALHFLTGKSGLGLAGAPMEVELPP